jgi:cobalt-zinc-cadmium efflux system protein
LKDYSNDVGHHHDHAHDHRPDARDALTFSLGLNAFFLVAEAGIGFWTGSLALLSDAAHMASDVGALLLALAANQLARRPASARMTFGLQRSETLGAFVNALSLVVVAAVVVHEAIVRIESGPPTVAGLPVLVVGSLGFLVNVGSAWALYRSDRDNLNVRAALVHMLADALGSVGAVVAALFLLRGVYVADPIVSLLIAALIASGSISILRDSGRILLQLPPSGLDVARIRLCLAQVEGVDAVHDLHAWTMDGKEPIVTAHLVTAAGADRDRIRGAAIGALETEFHITHATLQMEAASDPCVNADCGAPDDAPRTAARR